MAYNEEIAYRLSEALKLYPEEFTTKKMFGGLSFMYKNKMTVGVMKDRLTVRVIESKMNNLLSKSYCHPMDFTKKAMKEFLYVNQEGFEKEQDLLFWIDLGLEHAKHKLKSIL